MPVVREYIPALAANTTTDINLSPYDRFGQRGGRVTVAATTASLPGTVKLTVLVGSDQLAQNANVPQEASAGQGPNTETPTVSGFGAPADPITVRLTNTGAGTPIVQIQANIENA